MFCAYWQPCDCSRHLFNKRDINWGMYTPPPEAMLSMEKSNANWKRLWHRYWSCDLLRSLEMLISICDVMESRWFPLRCLLGNDGLVVLTRGTLEFSCAEGLWWAGDSARGVSGWQDDLLYGQWCQLTTRTGTVREIYIGQGWIIFAWAHHCWWEVHVYLYSYRMISECLSSVLSPHLTVAASIHAFWRYTRGGTARIHIVMTSTCLGLTHIWMMD